MAYEARAQNRVAQKKKTAMYRVEVTFEGDLKTRLHVEATGPDRARRQVEQYRTRGMEVGRAERVYFYRKRKPGPDVLAEICESMKAYFAAGIGTIETLRQHAYMYREPEICSAFLVALARVDSGYPLWRALRGTGLFDDTAIEVLRTGEETGSLDQCLGDLAKEYLVRAEIKESIKRAMFYPVVVVGMSVIAMVVFRLFVFRVMVQLYTELDIGVPFYLEWLRIAIDAVPFLVLAGVLVYRPAKALLSRVNKKYRYDLHRMLRRIKPLYRIVEDYTMVRSMSVMLVGTRAGLSSRDLYEMLARITWYEPIRRVYQTVYESLDNRTHRYYGMRPQVILEKMGEDFPGRVTALLSSADETGRYEDILGIIVANYRRALKRDVERFANFMEVAMIVFMGIAVGLLMVAFYFPYFQIFSRLG